VHLGQQDDVFNERDYELYGDMHPTLAEPGKRAKASSKNKPSGKAKSSSSKGTLRSLLAYCVRASAVVELGCRLDEHGR